MDQSPQKPVAKDFASNPTSAFADPNMRAKIHKHLTDINDVITEEDIRKINIDIRQAATYPQAGKGRKKV